MSSRPVLALFLVPGLVTVTLVISMRGVEGGAVTGAVVMSALFFVAYFPVTRIFLSRGALRGFLHYLFVLTLAPLYVVLLLLAVVLTFVNVPGFDRLFGALRDVTSHVPGVGTVRPAMWLAVPVCLVPAALCWLWYRVLLLIQRRLPHPDDAD